MQTMDGTEDNGSGETVSGERVSNTCIWGIIWFVLMVILIALLLRAFVA